MPETKFRIGLIVLLLVIVVTGLVYYFYFTEDDEIKEGTLVKACHPITYIEYQEEGDPKL